MSDIVVRESEQSEKISDHRKVIFAIEAALADYGGETISAETGFDIAKGIFEVMFNGAFFGSLKRCVDDRQREIDRAKELR